MSIFNELLPKINEISNAFTKNFDNELKAILESFDKFEADYYNGRNAAREKAPRDKTLMTTLQSINEDEDDQSKTPESDKPKRRSSNKSIVTQISSENEKSSSSDSIAEKPKRVSKKRSKDEVEGMSSPEQADKRTKRNASVKAQSIISKQKNHENWKLLNDSCVVVLSPLNLVNMSLMQKLRRDDTQDKKGHKKNDEDKENNEPSVIMIKQEKESLPPEPMDLESLPGNIEVKQELSKDEVSMPPPAAPVPKSRRGAKESQKDKSAENSEDESSSRRRTTRTKKQTEMPPPPTAGARATRASSRASSRKQQEDEIQLPPAEARPKRTRGRKKLSDTTASSETINESSQQPENNIASPADKPRPKRTRKAQKAAEKPAEVEEQSTPVEIKQERLTEPEISSSPILTKSKSNLKADAIKSKVQQKNDNEETHSNNNHIANETKTIISVESTLDETRVISKDKDMDKTMVLPNGVYNHEPLSPKNTRNMNETVVIEKQPLMDATVVIDKGPKAASNISEDNSILTDDNDEPGTPPRIGTHAAQPTSAVKEKVQQFEEMASRVTRTKTRAMAKRDEPTENQTPPDKISKPVLDMDTLTKMNSLIFNGKPNNTQLSSSACKPRSNIPTKALPSSTSKLSSMSKHREAAEDSMLRKEDARMKKEAMLEAKREQQRRKREEKMAAAAAARLAAERERAAAAIQAETSRNERLALLDHVKMEKRQHIERKKAELARKVAETEERRRLEEQARLQRLAEEQRRAEAQRRRQADEQDKMKKEAAIMAKEIEMKQKEYIEKQKMKRLEERKGMTPLKTFGTPSSMLPPPEPVYMQDGFQFLNSDEDEEPPERVCPAWSTSKARKLQLSIQTHVSPAHVDRLFSVRVHSPDLRDIFPAIDRHRLKRTSSAVWRTPPRIHE